MGSMSWAERRTLVTAVSLTLRSKQLHCFDQRAISYAVLMQQPTLDSPVLHLNSFPSGRWIQIVEIFAYSMLSCLVMNDAFKVALLKWPVPTAVA